MFAQNSLKVNNRNLSTAMEQLSTGSKINSAKDDAAGLAISTTMTAQIRGLSQAVRNANDGISMLQTAEGAMIEQTNMLQRMRELAVQASTATYTSTQRGYLDTEFQALDTQIDNIADQTKWNGALMLDQSGGSGTASGSYNFVVGSAGTETITVVIANTTNTASGLATTALAVGTTASALASITAIDTALGTINSARASIGAGINQLTYAGDNLNNVITNTTASRSQIMDTDYATATTQLARSQIIQQAATAMLAQANQSPQSVLALLK
jgi:flagellin